MPVYSSFIHKKGPMKGQPLAHLLAVLDGGLHLNLAGRHIFNERIKMALSHRQLSVMARAAGFKHIGKKQ